MKEVRVIVVGAAGKMGSRIIHIINETPSIVLDRAIERSDHPSIGKDIGEIIGLGKMNIPLEGDLKKGEGMSSLTLLILKPPSGVWNSLKRWGWPLSLGRPV